MNLSQYSRNRILDTFVKWEVPRDFADSLYNYLVYAMQPGSFFTAVLANDFLGAVARSHPGNHMESLKALGGWIQDMAPPESWGSYGTVETWILMSAVDRRMVLETCQLIYTEKQEVWMALTNAPTHEPVLY
jgi:hypothetical protein